MIGALAWGRMSRLRPVDRRMNQSEILSRDSNPALREYNALGKQIERGDPMHPREVQDVIDQLIEAGYPFQADALARTKINWDWA